MTDSKNQVLFQGSIENPLYDLTEWSSNRQIVVGIHSEYGFNNTRVEKLVQIIMPDDELLGDVESFRDLYGQEIETTATGARKLAELLIKAADAAEQRP